MKKESDLTVVRERLRTEYQILKRKSAGDDDSSGNKEPNPDRADLAQSYALHEKEAALQLIENNRLEQIERALERLEKGAYGQCSNCGRPINSDRLQVLPSAELCIRCQDKREGNT